MKSSNAFKEKNEFLALLKLIMFFNVISNKYIFYINFPFRNFMDSKVISHTHTKKDHRLKAYCLDEPKKHQANS